MHKKILISGATGFLGGAVLARALREGLGDRLLLIVRDATPESALRRVTDNLRLFKATRQEIDSLTTAQILCADLNDVDSLQSLPVLDQVECVVHSAALASFSDHPALDTINVEGTLSLAKLVHGRPSLKRFIYIGTAMACGTGAADNGVVSESMDLPPDREHIVPYTRSKAAAERRLRETFPDLPLIVVRPSIVVGHTTLGCGPSQSIFWVFLLAQMLGMFTIDLDQKVDVVPVDWCAEAIIALALRPTLSHRIYHLSAGLGSSVSFREVDAALASARGVNPVAPHYQQVSPDELEKLGPRLREVIPDGNKRLLLRAIKLYGAFGRLSYVFRNDHILSEGVLPPPPLTQYAGLCVASASGIPIVEQMKWDLK